jgi:hypothetical protein
MDISNKIMIGYCIMAVGGLFFIITLLMTIFLPLTASLNTLELANAPSNIIKRVIFLIIFVLIIMFGYYYKTKNQELLNAETEKIENVSFESNEEDE